MTSTAWLYLRLSKDKDTSADSLADQETKLRDKATAEGLTVGAVFNEGAGRSAYKRDVDRPEWDRLLSTVTAGVVVMAVETSRFSRDTEDGLRQIRRIRHAGAHVLTLDGNDTRSVGSALPLTVRLAVAEEESRLKGERLRRARARDRRLGKWAGRTPYGHRRRDDGRLELDPETAPTLRRLVDLALNGEGAAGIARMFNAEGIPNPNGARAGDMVERRNPKTKVIELVESLGWRQVSVSALLRNPVLCGWLPHDGQPVLGDDGAPLVCVVGPTIMTVGERGRLLSIVRERSHFDRAGARRGRGRPTDAVLGGVLRCGRCGASMAPSGMSYHCTARRSGGTCSGMSVTRGPVETEAMQRVMLWLAALDPEDERLTTVARAWIGTGDGGASEALAVEAAGELTEARERLAKLEEDHYVSGTLDAARFDALRSVLMDRIGSLELAATASAPSVDVGPLLDIVQSGEAIEAAPPEVVRSLVRACVVEAVMSPAPTRGGRFDRERLSLTMVGED